MSYIALILYTASILFFLSLMIGKTKNSILMKTLFELNKELNGILVPGTLFANPKLVVSRNGIEVEVSSMIAGASAGGSAGRTAICYATTRLRNIHHLVPTKNGHYQSRLDSYISANQELFEGHAEVKIKVVANTLTVSAPIDYIKDICRVKFLIGTVSDAALELEQANHQRTCLSDTHDSSDALRNNQNSYVTSSHDSYSSSYDCGSSYGGDSGGSCGGDGGGGGGD